MGLRSLLSDPNANGVINLVGAVVILMAILLLVPGVSQFMVGNWFLFGWFNLLLMAGFVIGAKMKPELIMAPLVPIVVLAGMLGMATAITLFVYFNLKVRRNEKAYDLRTNECEGKGTKNII
jgi:hypothetical protein